MLAGAHGWAACSSRTRTGLDASLKAGKTPLPTGVHRVSSLDEAAQAQEDEKVHLAKGSRWIRLEVAHEHGPKVPGCDHPSVPWRPRGNRAKRPEGPG